MMNWDWLIQTSSFIENNFYLSSILRIVLAALAGSLVGIERSVKGRAAGLRTHMLVCLGSAITAMIGVYLGQELGIPSDATRISAQVMSGVGFLGAGTILLKKGNSRVTGLTTAAGLWATAAIGLAVGYGFYFVAFIAVIIVILTFSIVPLEYLMTRKSQRIAVYLEINAVDGVQDLIKILADEFDAEEIQVTPARSNTPNHVGIETLIHIPPKETIQKTADALCALEHVMFVLHQ